MWASGLTTERKNVPFSPSSLKVGIMNVSTRIQSLVLENNMKGKLVLTEIEKKNLHSLLFYSLLSLLFKGDRADS